ncbi:mannosyl-oligosaccharide alpha-1,2-mannosidase IA-like [Anastrepha obliqua]|uniref:mannosyl-oligosaccharide alpha-1,2-mannosidase IA-like n=1 Tax=Anastrepha obliqua TaxID=95512 RepID=UPI00240909EC|nr:mannosyl-oligosaccharide alpha-1,2-mannosidase IA-like [Anastrepha obliqua]
MYRIGPIGRKSNFHLREKFLIGLVLATLCLLCFGGIFLLPDNFGGDRVLRVYKQFQKAGPEMFIPAPPLAGHAPKDSDPHFIGDRQKLQAKIKEELGDILDKPLLQQHHPDAGYDGEELGAADDGQQQQQGVAPPLNGEGPPETVNPAGKAHTNNNNDDVAARMDNNNLPVGKVASLQFGQNGNADPDPAVEEKRQKVKEVSESIRTKTITTNKTTLKPLQRDWR